MLTRDGHGLHLSRAASLLARRCILLLLTLSLLVAPLAGQSKRERDQAAEELYKEGARLFKENTKESLEDASRKFTEALPLFHSADNNLKEALTLAYLGYISRRQGDDQQANTYFTRALPLLRSVGGGKKKAIILIDIALFCHSSGFPQMALEYFTEAASVFHDTDDRIGEGRALNGIGEAYYLLGARQKALDKFTQALSVFRTARSREGESVVLTNIGGVYRSLGQTQKGLVALEQSLSVARAINNHLLEGRALTDVGRIHKDLGKPQAALDALGRALLLLREAKASQDEAVVLYNIGWVYNALGEQQKALHYYNQALVLSRPLKARDLEAFALTGIGKTYMFMGEYRKALDYNVQALSLFRARGDRSGEAQVLNNIGYVYNLLGDQRTALDYCMQALPILHAFKDRQAEGYVLNNVGFIYNALGDQRQALDYYSKALPLLRSVEDHASEADTLGNIAVIERQRGNLVAALAKIESGRGIIESLRANIASQELRASYFATAQNYYEFNIDLLMQMHRQRPSEGYDGLALEVSERGRARSLIDLLTEAGADIRQGVDPTLVERERSLQQQLNDAARRKMLSQGEPNTEEQAQAIAKEIDALTAELQQVKVQIRQTSPRYADLTQPQPLTLREIQTQSLDGDTLLLEYSLGKDRSYLWAVTQTSITSYELPRREEIEAASQQLYKLITAPPRPASGATPEGRDIGGELQRQSNVELAQVSARLSRMLLSPVAPLLGRKRLLVVADGVLQYIPFAALPALSGDAGATSPAPLIAEHEIVNLPSASMLAVLRREAGRRLPATNVLAVLADPVFNSGDERLEARASRVEALRTESVTSIEELRGLSPIVGAAARQSGVTTHSEQHAPDACSPQTPAKQPIVTAREPTIPRLPCTRREAEEIVKLVPPGQYKKALDFAASRATATSPELAQYRYVHFATHGLLDSQRPELSGIVLSLFDEEGNPQDGFLRAHEIYNLRLAADVVVLSACQTGLGKEIRGEGLVGLTRGFMYAGAPRVVVSLWSINDAATAELMTRFYRRMVVDKLRPAQALQEAQVSMLNDKRFASPFYWAAFTLQGEWR